MTTMGDAREELYMKPPHDKLASAGGTRGPNGCPLPIAHVTYVPLPWTVTHIMEATQKLLPGRLDTAMVKTWMREP